MPLTPEQRDRLDAYEAGLAHALQTATQISMWEMLRRSAERFPDRGDGIFHSGDYGWLDADGFLYYRGRYKMMVKTGGENVAQREVEIFLEDQLPFVKHAEVVGIPDERWGEAVVAFVEFFGGDERSQEEMRTLCTGKIANFKIPKHFIVVAPGDWPALGSGRMDKQALLQRAIELLVD